MKLLLIVAIVVLVLFVVVMLVAPGGAKLSLEGQKGVAADFEDKGPPGWLKSLGGLMPSRPIPIESPPANCPDGTTRFAATGNDWRVLRLSLKTGNAGLVVVSLLDPRRDDESGPYRICLGTADPIGCSNTRIEREASVPIGPRGACIAIVYRNPPAEVAFN